MAVGVSVDHIHSVYVLGDIRESEDHKQEREGSWREATSPECEHSQEQQAIGRERVVVARGPYPLVLVKTQG